MPEPNQLKIHNLLTRTGAALLLCGLFLGGCSHTPPQTAVPAKPEVDPATFTDAVPHYEPRAKYGNPTSYIVMGQRYFVRPSAEGYIARGIASWYGPDFHGKLTSTRETYDMYQMTAAHKDLPLPTFARVTNLENGRSIVVRINDRGPFHDDRVIDLSYAAAYKLDMIRKGTAEVEVQAITPEVAPPRPVYSSQDFKQRATKLGEAALRVPAVQRANISAQPSVMPPQDPSLLEKLYLQLGAFSTLDNAERLRARLMLDSSRPEQVIIHQGHGLNGPLYKVRIGPLTDMDEATTLSARLTNYGYNEPRVVLD